MRLQVVSPASRGGHRKRWVSTMLRLALLTGLSLSLALHSASAALLPPGTATFAVGSPDPTGGALIAGGVPVPFVAPTFSGTLTSSVIAGDPSNPFGGLTFTYLVTNDPLSAHSIERLTINDFAGWLVDASYQTPAAGTVPVFNDRSLVGDVVGFSFMNPMIGFGIIAPGGSSALLVLQTNAPDYQPTIASVIDGTVASVASWAPAVPEPSSMLLAAVGAALAAWQWKRNRLA